MQLTENQRLKIIREHFNFTQKEMGELFSLKQGSYADIERGKVKISGTIKRYLETQNLVNIHWLETGQGEMFKQKKRAPRIEAVPLHLASDPNDYDNDGTRFEDLADGTIRMRVPIVPYKAFAAGYLRGFQDPEFYEDLEYISIDVFKRHSGHYLAFEVKGDSMTTLDPQHFRQSIFDGVKVIGRELPRSQWSYKLHTHNWDSWVIVHKEEGILIKQIIAHDVDRGAITIHSLNPDKTTYPDQELFLDDVEQIFNVVKKIDE